MGEETPKRKKKTPDLTTTIRLPAELYDEVQEFISEERISMSEFFRQAAREVMNRKGKPPAEYAPAEYAPA